MKNFFSLFLFLLVFGSTALYSQSCNRANDSLQLVELYQMTSGDLWERKWNLNNSMDSWYGVTLTNDGCVTKVELPGNNLNGVLPDLDLPFLRSLNLSRNAISGDLPKLNNLPDLRFLNLSQNTMSGQLTELMNSDLLIDIRLNDNSFSGAIPSFQGITTVQNLYLQNNNLTGQIPDLNHFDLLFNLNLANNRLSGAVPSFTGLNFLVSLNITNNNLSGKIPQFAAANNLELYLASNNNFTSGLGDLLYFRHLKQFILHNNKINSILTDFSNMPSLEVLDMHSNRLQGRVITLQNFRNIRSVDLSYNNLRGSVPRTSGLSDLESIDLSFNELNGSILPWANMPSLETMNFSNNQLEMCELVASDISGVNNLFLENNNLTFEDLYALPRSNFEIFTYSPQGPIVMSDTVEVLLQGLVRLDLVADQFMSTNNYSWYKDNNLIGTNQGNNYLVISNAEPADEGEYYSQVSNPNWPDLVLRSSLVFVDVICETYTEDIKTTRCIGDSILVRGKWRYKDFQISDTVLATDGFSCDSIFDVEVNFTRPLESYFNVTICEGETYEFMGTTYEKGGVYDTRIDSAGYCAHDIRLILDEQPRYSTNHQYFKCPADTLFVGDLSIIEPGLYSEMYQSVYGCDSLANYYVSYHRYIESDSTIYFCEDSIDFMGQTYFDKDTLLVEDDTVSDCVLATNFTFSKVSTQDTLLLDTIVCFGNDLIVDGIEIDTSGIYFTTIDHGNSCQQTRLVRAQFTDDRVILIDTFFCDGEVFEFENIRYYEDTVLTFTGTDIHGCEANYAYNVMRRDVIETYVTDSICFGEILTVGDNVYNLTGIYRDTTYTNTGCNLLTTVDLFVSHLEIKDSIVSYDDNSALGSIKFSIKGGVPPYTYMWSTADTTQNLVNIPTGKYSVRVTDAMNCTSEFEFIVGPYVSTFNQRSEVITLYPNLIKSGQQINWILPDQTKAKQFTLINAMGKSVWARELTDNQSSIRMSEDIPPGVYSAVISTDSGIRKVSKLIITDRF